MPLPHETMNFATSRPSNSSKEKHRGRQWCSHIYAISEQDDLQNDNYIYFQSELAVFNFETTCITQSSLPSPALLDWSSQTQSHAEQKLPNSHQERSGTLSSTEKTSVSKTCKTLQARSSISTFSTSSMTQNRHLSKILPQQR